MPINMMLRLAWQSLLYRRGAVALTVATIAVSVFTLLGTEHIRQAARQSFSSTVSGVDLIVGPRTSEVNLLLTTVFRIGNPSQNMSWQSYQGLLALDDVAWAIPMSLGDSHKGFRVVGTQEQFFTQFHYGQSRPLMFDKGHSFFELYDAVLGAQVARQLKYKLKDSLILSHGIAATSFHQHKAHPFSVVGVLEPTGTPIDNALYVSLAGLEAIHSQGESRQSVAGQTLEPTGITSAMIGLESKFATFKVQRQLNTALDEPLTAILPGVALTQLWQMSRGLESTLQLMAHLILAASLMGLGAMLLATLRERRYEIAILRTLGAGAKTLFCLIQMEAIGVVLLGILLGSSILALAVTVANRFVVTEFGIDISLHAISSDHALTLLYVVAGAILIGFVPAATSLLKSRHPS